MKNLTRHLSKKRRHNMHTPKDTGLNNHAHNLSRLQKSMWLFAVLVSLFVLALTYSAYHFITTDHIHKRTDRLMRVTSAERSRAEKEISQVRDNFLTIEHWLKRLPETERLQRPHEITDLFVSFMETHNAYLQLRLLSLEGREIIRVERVRETIHIIPPHKLQDKSHHPYFQETRQLPDNAIYLSDTDLNRERGRIEQPYRPVFRLASPLTDHDGKRWGYLVMNYSVDPLMTTIAEAKERAGKDSYLSVLNAEGFWLKAPRSEWEWGHVLPSNSVHRIQNNFPNAWQAMLKNNEGTLHTDKGAFAYGWLKVDMKNINQTDTRSLASLRWLIMAHLPAKDIDALVRPRRLQAGIGGLIVWVLCMGLLWLLYRNRTQHFLFQQAERRTARRTQKILESTSSGIIVSNAETGRIEYANAVAARMAKTEPESLKGRQTTECIILNEEKQGKMDLLRKGEIEALLHEGFLKQMDGEMLPIYYSAALIQDDNLPMIVNSFIDFSDQQSHREKLHKEARTDALTGIGNRRFFKEELDREMGRIRRHGGDLTLLAFDIDHFKKVNDTHGHEAGDRVLQEVSRMAEKTLRRSDILGRTGGEEFTALLVETDLEHAREVAERLRENMQAMHVQVGKTSIAITISIGLAKCDIGMDAETLMRRADEKLYVSKETGRNRVSS